MTVAGEFVHPALFYSSDEEYLDALVPFVTEGLASGEPVAVAVPGDRLRVLRAAVGAAADGVLWLDMTVAGRNPGRIIPAVLRKFADPHPDRHVRIVGEPIWAGRSETEYPACAQHEALINHAFAGRDVTIVCPYDTGALDAHVVEDARATHPEVWEADRRYTSARYAPDDVVARYNQPLPGVPAPAEFTVTGETGVRPARRWAAAYARSLGLDEPRVPDLELIVTELVTNSIRHATGSCRVHLWHTDGHLCCAVRDGGHLSDPLAGRLPRSPTARGGRGLLLVHQLADLVRTHTVAGSTTQYALLRLAK
ncbi:anti-sigma factor RsbA family regulatory protein [Amycolatopsis thermophila]|uniref:Anti-sigma regulatory factor (Ser/Thr protein kinase) n=1 Tax=Amycolatopsis thermophila TaxID=206084 RepID=A0ABU0EXK3_9PSEU|nr:anti-sigma factor RsbA family regulatory protein [Amycolatopsis thermophila]MDQ0380055.1 anti-sigma regulatory factor (Ser/Thr protein kinase) [Amycolatopsis thermophila]